LSWWKYACLFHHDDGDTEWLYTGGDMNELMIRDLIAGVEGRWSVVSTASGLDGLRALEVALAAYQSHREGEPIEIESHARREA
jgi:predicted dehydrogenase